MFRISLDALLILDAIDRLGSFAAAGKELLKEGRHLLKTASDLEHRVRRVASGWETELTIGMDSVFSPTSLTHDVTEFCKVAVLTRLKFSQETLSGTWEAPLDMGRPADWRGW